MSSCTPFINWTSTKEVPCFREGKSPRLKGNPNFRPSLSFIFFQWSTYHLKWMCSNLTFFRTHLPYLGDCVHFLRINYAHNSNSNNRCIKRCTRTVWKTMLVLYKKWNTWLENMTPCVLPWYGLTVPWLKVEKVWFMSLCTPFINRTIIEEVQCFREGNHQDWRGIQISVLVCHSVFFQRSTYRLKWNVLKFEIFQTHLPYLGHCVHFLGINYAHNSNSNKWCLKRCTRTV